jgi:hypothetical protein
MLCSAAQDAHDAKVISVDRFARAEPAPVYHRECHSAEIEMRGTVQKGGGRSGSKEVITVIATRSCMPDRGIFRSLHPTTRNYVAGAVHREPLPKKLRELLERLREAEPIKGRRDSEEMERRTKEP